MIQVPDTFMALGDRIQLSEDEELVRRLAMVTMDCLRDRHGIQDEKSFISTGMKEVVARDSAALWELPVPTPAASKEKSKDGVRVAKTGSIALRVGT
jgi:hypothetical protein